MPVSAGAPSAAIAAAVGRPRFHPRPAQRRERCPPGPRPAARTRCGARCPAAPGGQAPTRPAPPRRSAALQSPPITGSVRASGAPHSRTARRAARSPMSVPFCAVTARLPSSAAHRLARADASQDRDAGDPVRGVFQPLAGQPSPSAPRPPARRPPRRRPPRWCPGRGRAGRRRPSRPARPPRECRTGRCRAHLQQRPRMVPRRYSPAPPEQAAHRRSRPAGLSPRCSIGSRRSTRMTAAVPAAIAAWKGGRSRRRSSAIPPADRGQHVVGVGPGAAVAGEVLGARREPPPTAGRSPRRRRAGTPARDSALERTRADRSLLKKMQLTRYLPIRSSSEMIVSCRVSNGGPEAH